MNDLTNVQGIKNEIERLEDCLFELKMKDRWSSQDYSDSSMIYSKIAELKKRLGKYE